MRLKSLILGYLIAALIFLPMQLWATDYYAQKGSCNINSVSSGTTSDVWNTNPGGGGTWYSWTTNFSDGITTGDNFYANAQTALAVNVSPGESGKIPTLRSDAGDGTAGGGFTLNTSLNTTVYLNTKAGTSHCVALSGNSGGLTLEGSTCVGGDAGTAYGIYDTHTVVDVVNNITTNQGGASTGGNGYAHTGSSGTLSITGSCEATVGIGCSSSHGEIVTINNCKGSDTTISEKAGCYGSGGTTGIAVTGNRIDGTHGSATSGKITWVPANAQKYIKTDSGGTPIYASAGLGSDAGGTQVSAANTAAKIKDDSYFVKKDDGVYTQGTATSTGGGSSPYAY